MEIQGSQQKAGVQEATQQAKAAVNAARDRVKENLEELQEIQSELQSAKEARAAGRDVNVEGLEKRISDIQVSMTASVEEAGREVSQATDKAKRTVAAETGSKSGPESATAGGAGAAGGTSSAAPQEPEEGEDDDVPTPHASQGINQGFYVRRSHSGQAAGDMTDSGEDPDEPPAAREALGPDSAARGAHMAAPAAPSTEQGGRDDEDDVPTPNASQGINQGFYARRSGSGDAEDDDDDDDEGGPQGSLGTPAQTQAPARPHSVLPDPTRPAPGPRRPQRSAQALHVGRYRARLAAGDGGDSEDEDEDDFGQPCPCGKPHAFDRAHKAPSTNDILASMDDSNSGAVDATRANQATLENMAAQK